MLLDIWLQVLEGEMEGFSSCTVLVALPARAQCTASVDAHVLHELGLRNHGLPVTNDGAIDLDTTNDKRPLMAGLRPVPSGAGRLLGYLRPLLLRQALCTGVPTPRSGIWSSSDCGYEIALSKEDNFPPCPQHRKAVTWTLIRPTN